MLSAEITVKYRVKNVMNEQDLQNYFGDGRQATIEEAIEDMLTVCTLSDLTDDNEGIIIEVKQV